MILMKILNQNLSLENSIRHNHRVHGLRVKLSSNLRGVTQILHKPSTHEYCIDYRFSISRFGLNDKYN